MPVPPNTTAATAVEIVAGDTVILDVRDATPPTHTVWYKHTPPVAGTYLSLWATTDSGSNYVPRTRVYTGTPSSLTLFLTTTGKQFLIPIDDTALTYFFEIFNTGVTEPLTSDLNFSAVAAPNVNTPAGSVAVNEDAEGYPLVIFTPTGGVLNQLAEFPSGEFGAILTDGTLLVEDRANGTVVLYNDVLEMQATIPTPVGFTGAIGAMGSNQADTFVIGMASTGQIADISSTGVVTPQAWDVNNVSNLTFSVDGTILYYTGDGSAVSAAVKRITYPGGVPLTNLANGRTNYFVVDMITLTDDTIIVAYFKSTGTDDNSVRQYAPDGTILHQYEFGADDQINHLTSAIDDPASFWVWFYTLDGFSKFSQIKVSDGSVLTTFTIPTYVSGVCDITGALQTTDTRFGTPFSCPFWITRSSWPEEIPPDEFGLATELPIRWVRRTPVLG